jgi:hypothetical protein
VTTSHGHLARLHHHAHSLHRRVQAFKERGEKMADQAIRTVEVCTGALIGGVIQGKAGPKGAHVAGVPVDLGLGLAGKVAAFFEAFGKNSEHVGNVADGFLGAYVSQVGFGIGQRWLSTGSLGTALKGGASQGAMQSGQPQTATSGVVPSPAAMASIMSQIPNPHAA